MCRGHLPPADHELERPSRRNTPRAISASIKARATMRSCCRAVTDSADSTMLDESTLLDQPTTCLAVCREIRNIDLQKGGRAKDGTKPKADAVANPQASSLVSRWTGRHGRLVCLVPASANSSAARHQMAAHHAAPRMQHGTPHTCTRSLQFAPPRRCCRCMLQGKREEGVDWRPTLQAMRLTPPQAAAIVDARAQVTVKLDE